MRFHEWRVLYFDSNLTEVILQGSNWQWCSIGSDNGLARTRRQAIIWTNADPVHMTHICGTRGRWVKSYRIRWALLLISYNNTQHNTWLDFMEYALFSTLLYSPFPGKYRLISISVANYLISHIKKAENVVYDNVAIQCCFKIYWNEIMFYNFKFDNN